MLTGKDARYEDKKAGEILASDKPLGDKLKAIGKLISVTLRIALNNRVNIVKIMEKLGVDKVKPEAKREEEKK